MIESKQTNKIVLLFKGVGADYILIPGAQQEVVYILMSNERPYFSDYESKISPPNYL